MGYIYFCLNDYRTQMGEEGYGKFQIRRHGITDASLNLKTSYYVLKQLASPIEITKVKQANDNEALVELKVKGDIPCYILRGYSIEYKSSTNKIITIKLPDLYPKNTYSFTLRDINPQFKFQVIKPGGYNVINY